MPIYTKYPLPSQESDEEYFDRTSKKYGETLGRYLDATVTPYEPVSVPGPVPPPDYGPAPIPNFDWSMAGQPPAQAAPVAAPVQAPVTGPITAQPMALPSEQPRAMTVSNTGGDFAGMDWEGGLGLAARQRYGGGRPNLGEYLAQEMYPDANLSRMEKNRLAWNATQGDYMQNRQNLARQLAQQEETARQHDLQFFGKAMEGPNAKMKLDALSQNPKFRYAKQAGQLSRIMKDADFSAIQAFQDALPPEVMQKFMRGEMDDYELSAWADTAREQIKFNQKEQAKAQIIKAAMNKDPEQRTPYEEQLVREKQEADTKKQMEALKDYSIAAKNFKDAEQGPDDKSEDNRIHQALTGGLPWAQGTDQTRQAALQYKYKGYAQGKANVTAGTPLGQLGKAQEHRDPITGKAAPAWATPDQVNSMGYVNIEPTQVPTVTQLENVEGALKEILAAGSALIRQETGGGGLFDIPGGFIQTPYIKLIRKYAGDPNAEILNSAINRITPTLSKLGGDTANVAVEERKIYKDAIFSDADTLGSFVEKIKSIKKANDRTKGAMGFVPDEKAYMRRLAIQGKTDEQIKAIMEERKRMQ